MPRPPHELLQAIQQGRRYIIVGHIDPDPDSTGSVLAMQRLLVALGKEAVAVTPNPLPASVRFLPGSERMRLPDEVTSEEWDDLIVLDCGIERIGPAAPFAESARTVINIDHHGTNPGSGDVFWVDPNYAATAQMIATLYDALDVEIDRESALQLYAGIAGDTGTFRFSNTNAGVLRLGARLVDLGVQPGEVTENLYEQHSLAYLRLVGMLLESVTTAFNERVIYARLTRQMKEAAGVKPEEVNGLIQFLRLVRSADIAFLLEQIDAAEVKVQFRSSAAVDVSQVARALGGGGHPRAAGCRLRFDMETAEAKVLREVEAALPNSSAR